MKNLKNMLSAAALMVVLGVGAASANTGLLISDKSNQPCTVKDNFINQLAGVVVIGMPSLDGIIITDRDGIIITDRQDCQSSDSDGIIITDRDGIIITD